MSSTAVFTELLSGILRFFPNSIFATLFVIGITTGRLSWILLSFGGLVMLIVTTGLQYIFGTGFGFGRSDSLGVVEACSLVPTIRGAPAYSAFPSLWVTLTSFIVGYIFTNAANIYAMPPTGGVSNDKISVQQRKGMGLISMVTVSILFLFLLVPRFWSSCESLGSTGITIGGFIFSLMLGISFGISWWYIMTACDSKSLPDIHGVGGGIMGGKGLRGALSPLACKLKKPAKT